MFARKQRLAVGSALSAALVLVLAACGAAGQPAGNGQTAGGTPPAGTAGTARPGSGPGSPATGTPGQAGASAADQLSGFLAAAQSLDNQEHHAAALVNGGVGRTRLNFPPATVQAVTALSAVPLARSIPAGLPPELLRRTLLVYSDLVSRERSLGVVTRYVSPMPAGGEEAGEVLHGLSHGAPAAARFDADLAALRTLARSAPPVTVAGPGSRAAGDVAVRVRDIDLRNSGCAASGGTVVTTLAEVVWQPKYEPGIGHSDGTIDGIRFRAGYEEGRGWEVELWAC